MSKESKSSVPSILKPSLASATFSNTVFYPFLQKNPKKPAMILCNNQFISEFSILKVLNRKKVFSECLQKVKLSYVHSATAVALKKYHFYDLKPLTGYFQ